MGSLGNTDWVGHGGAGRSALRHPQQRRPLDAGEPQGLPPQETKWAAWVTLYWVGLAGFTT